MVNDFDVQAANQIPKIIANETVDEVELVLRQGRYWSWFEELFIELF